MQFFDRIEKNDKVFGNSKLKSYNYIYIYRGGGWYGMAILNVKCILNYIYFSYI